jgi:tRNA threonylcarbamoyladenosine biosynthesis protein TsaB
VRLLSVDTATTIFSVALADGPLLLGEETGAAGPATTVRLAPAIEGLLTRVGLAPAELDGFAVTVGPGSFTGLRVGIALVCAMAYGVGKPVFPVSSLELLAMNAPPGSVVCPMLDARKAEVYCALFRRRELLETVVAEGAHAPESFIGSLEGPVLFLGDGAERYRAQIADTCGPRAEIPPAGPLHQLRAAAAIPLVLSGHLQPLSPAAILPRYLRRPEAELNRR